MKSALLGCLLSLRALAAGDLATVAGRVVDRSGAPVSGATATVFNAQQAVVAAAQTDERGEFRLDLPPNTYALEITKRDFAPRRVPVEARREQPLRLNLSLTLSPVASEITVTAETSQVESVARIAQRVNVIPENVLAERAVTTLSEAADGEPGVAQQKTSPSLGGFFVRGLTGKGVAVYRDGVRYSTSAQRGGVSTFLNLQDAAHLDSIEVLRGPNSAQYGSDSLGGTVSMISRSPAFAPSGRFWHGEIAPLYNYATHGLGGSALLSYSTPRLAALASASGRRINTARTGRGLDSHAAVTRFLGLPSNLLGARLPDTGFTQYGGLLRVNYRLAEGRQISGHYERSQQDGSKRYDQLLGGDGNLIADLRNLMLDFAYLRYSVVGAGFFNQASVSASYNAQREERVNQGGQGDPAGPITRQYERTQVWGLSFQLEKRAGVHSITLGGEGYRERIAAPAFTVNPLTAAVTITRPRVPHGALYWQHGLFVQEIWSPLSKDRLRVSGALRFGGASYRSRAANSPLVGGRPLFPDDSLAANHLTGRAGVVVTLAEPLSIHTQYSHGFRAPNVTDLGTLGLQGNGFYETSAAELAGRGAVIGSRADDRAVSTGAGVERARPETSDNFDLGFQVRTSRFRAELTGFWMNLGNTIVSQTLLLPPGAVGQPLGDQIVSRQLASGAVFVPLAANPVLVRANHGGARIRGLEHSLRLRLTPTFSVRENFTWVRASDRITGAPPDIEPGVPPAAMHLNLLYAPPSRRHWVELYGVVAGRQERLSSLALADRRVGASRSRASIASFFENGARVRGLVADGRLRATGETLAQVQQRVLGGADSAPLFLAIPGYGAVGLRGGFPLGERADVILDFSNILDKNYHGIGWGLDAPGRSLTARYRFRF